MGLLSSVTDAIGLSGGGGGQQTVSNSPWAPAQPYLQDALSNAQDMYNRTQGLNPIQAQGMDFLSQYAQGGLQDLTGTAMEGVNFLASGDVMSPDSNPYLQQTADAYADQVNEQLNRTTLSGIDDQFMGAGQGWNSSRQGIERGLARGEASEAIANRTGQMYSDAYNRGIEAMQSGLSMAPQIGQFGALPGQMLQSVGDYQDSAPWQDLMNYSNVATSVGGMGGQQVSPQSSGGLLGAVGGASAGAGLAGTLSDMGAIGAESAGPWGFGMTAAGGLLGALS